MKIEIWPVDKPVPYAKNARNISDQAVEKVASSIQAFGFRQPLVVDKKGVIVVGHARLMGAKKLGLKRVPVHRADNLMPAQIRAYRLADNRTNQETEWDTERLCAELKDLMVQEFDLALTGFDPDELAAYTVETTEGLTDEDEAPAVQEFALTGPGDLWTLGNHRLLCGDATSISVVEGLMDGRKGDMVFTDPPYNVDYEGYTEERLTIQGDLMDAARFSEFLRDTFVSLRWAASAEASLYVCQSSSWQRKFEEALEDAGFEVRCQIIWAKNTFAWGFDRYKFQHEPIFYAHVGGQSDPWYGDKSQSTLWQEKKPAANRVHPTMKPVELIERGLMNSSHPGDMVVDLFGGSGSTMIACEKTGRCARLMELDPKYCDVIVKRWQDFTGKTAHLEGGRTLAELESKRKKKKEA